jgi:hypothetical protein
MAVGAEQGAFGQLFFDYFPAFISHISDGEIFVLGFEMMEL